MNITKLNELAAKAMGWNRRSIDGGATTAWCNAEGKFAAYYHWSPATCADDALTLGAKLCSEMPWKLEWDEKSKTFLCDIIGAADFGRGKEAPKAMTICFLRAAGISEAEIGEALL